METTATATSWASEHLSGADYYEHQLTGLRERVSGHKATADRRMTDLTECDDMPHTSDKQLVAMMGRLYGAFCTEHAKAIAILARERDKQVADPESSLPPYHAERDLTESFAGKPLIRMEQILQSMRELAILPYYEDDTLE